MTLNSFKKISGGILMGLALLMLAACSNAGAYQKSVYGDDGKISAQGDSYTFANRVGSTDDTGASLEFSGFSGKQTLWDIDAAKAGTITLEVEAGIKSGKFKLCLIGPDDIVSIIAEGSVTDTIAVAVDKGASRIVMVGSNAKGEIDAVLTCDDSLSIQAAEEQDLSFFNGFDEDEEDA